MFTTSKPFAVTFANKSIHHSEQFFGCYENSIFERKNVFIFSKNP
jgi:hypothetical protein